MDSINDALSGPLPTVAEGVVSEADQLLMGLHAVPPGRGAPAFMGDPPDWFVDSNKNPERLWALNRMEHWPVLLRAYGLTRNRQYANKVAVELDDWLKRCPRPEIVRCDVRRDFDSATPWRIFEAAVRMSDSWRAVWKLREDTDFMSSDRLATFTAAVYLHGELLAAAPSIVWPKADHLHYQQAMVGLLSAAGMFPDPKTSEAWRTLAVKELARYAEEQLTSDGGHVEGCPDAHNLAVSRFCKAVLIGDEQGAKFPESFLDRLRHALDYAVHASRPSGRVVPWGESDPASSALKAAILGYRTFQNPQWLAVLSGFYEPEAFLHAAKNHLWELEDPAVFVNAIENRTFSEQAAGFPTVNWQRDLNQVSMRTSWKPNAISLFFCCRTPVNSGRAHIDPMSFDLTALGKPVMVDPGPSIRMEHAEDRDFRSATWHNTATVDDREPFEYRGNLKYGPQKEGRVLWVSETEEFLASEAVQHNFDPVVHRRLIVLFDKRYVLVLDRFENLSPESTVQLYWHFNSSKVSWDEVQQQARAGDDEVQIWLRTPSKMKGEMLEGRICDGPDGPHPSSRLKLVDTPARSSRTYATLIIPYRTDEPAPQLRAAHLQSSSVEARLVMTEPRASRELIWRFGESLSTRVGMKITRSMTGALPLRRVDVPRR